MGRHSAGIARNCGCTQQELHEIADVPGAIRAGSTKNPKQRLQDYRQEGYSGTMYYTRTDNMYRAETRLLQGHEFRHNMHDVSNASEERGFVYVVKGKRFS